MSVCDPARSAENGGRLCAESERGEVRLQRRDRDGAWELRVNGVFVMDTAHTDTERAMATAALAELSVDRDLRVLIGGLGLGFTVREVLDDRRVRSLCVAEIEPAIVDWMRSGIITDTADSVRDSRTEIRIDDVVSVVSSAPSASWELMLLDVDNGPGYLVHEQNVAVYDGDFLARCRRALAVGGVLAVWSASAAPALSAVLREHFARVREVRLPVLLEQTDTAYYLYLGMAE